MYSNGPGPPGGSISGGSITSSSSSISSRSKRNKRSAWGAKERAGMSFMIVVAFFAIFGIIILTEVLMIDDRGRNGGVIVRHANLGNRMGESIPDYEDVKDDYNLEEAGIFLREKIGGNSLKGILKNPNVPSSLDSNNNLRMSIGIPIAPDSTDPRNGVQAIPWGQILPSKIERTLPPYLTGMMPPTDGSWQVVNGTRFKFFVFSAFYDRRDGRMIRVIGATKTRGPERVWCRMWYLKRQGNSTRYRSATVMARVKVIRENWNLKYSACFILCPLRAAHLDVPYAVSIVSRLRAPPGNVLLLRNTDHDQDFVNRNVTNIPDKLSICVKPLHFNYDQALYLLEYLELNTLLGVSHFTLYNHTIGPRASCVLRHYMEGGSHVMSTVALNNNTSSSSQNDPLTRPKSSVSILPWNLKMRSQKEIRTEGLFAALNDCLYRSMYRNSHVALVDLDEFIIPRHNETLSELLEWLSLRINSRNTGAYSFQNAFFYLQFPDDDLMYEESNANAALRGALVTQRKTRRRSKLHPQKQRSKYICKPEAVIEAGNHFVWEFIPGRGSLNVPAESAILHHYRVCEFGGDDCIKTPSMVDRTAHKYTKELLDRVGAMYNLLKEPCNLPDLPPVPTRPQLQLNTRQNKKKISKKSALLNDSNAVKSQSDEGKTKL